MWEYNQSCQAGLVLPVFSSGTSCCKSADGDEADTCPTQRSSCLNVQGVQWGVFLGPEHELLLFSWQRDTRRHTQTYHHVMERAANVNLKLTETVSSSQLLVTLQRWLMPTDVS